MFVNETTTIITGSQTLAAASPVRVASTAAASIALDNEARKCPLAYQQLLRTHGVHTVASAESRSECIKSLCLQKALEPGLDSFYIVDLGTIVRKVRQWKALLPRVRPFYAVKCNPDPLIIATLAAYDCGFDCASQGEFSLVMSNPDFAIDGSRIIFANTVKPPSHIVSAKARGVDLMTVDNVDELHKIKRLFPEARLVLRVKTDDSQSVCRFSTKFGVSMEGDVDTMLATAQRLGLTVVGVSFHVGSGCRSLFSYIDALRRARSVFDRAPAYGFDLRLLDLGGGWPGMDDGSDVGCPFGFSDIADAIRPVLDELFPVGDCDIIAEPGRYFAAESHTLATQVFGRREVKNPELGRTMFYHCPDGVYQSFNCTLFDHYQPTPMPLVRSGATAECDTLFNTTIWGPTCDSMDVVARDIQFPELQIGDWMWYRCMGAYTRAAASPFNGFPAGASPFYVNIATTEDTHVDDLMLAIAPAESWCNASADSADINDNSSDCGSCDTGSDFSDVACNASVDADVAAACSLAAACSMGDQLSDLSLSDNEFDCAQPLGCA